MVHGGEVHADVETEEEHELDQEAGVDQDVGDARPHPDCDTGGWCPIQSIGKAK